LGNFGGYVYVDNVVFQNSQATKNVMLRRTGPHMISSIARSKRKLVTSVREYWASWVHANLEFTITDKLLNCELQLQVASCTHVKLMCSNLEK